MSGPLRLETHPDGTHLALRVSAGAARERILGVHDGALKLAVRAAPERGKANRAVLCFLSRVLDLPARRLALVSGETSRTKRVLIRDSEPEEVRRRLDRILPRL